MLLIIEAPQEEEKGKHSLSLMFAASRGPQYELILDRHWSEYAVGYGLTEFEVQVVSFQQSDSGGQAD